MSRASLLLKLCGASFGLFIGFIWLGGAAGALGAPSRVIDLIGDAYVVTGLVVIAVIIWRARRR